MRLVKRGNFNYDKVIKALDRKGSFLWRTLSAQGKKKINKAKVIKAVRSHEQDIERGLAEAEVAIARGWTSPEDYLQGERCNLQGGYQGYVTLTYINRWQ